MSMYDLNLNDYFRIILDATTLHCFKNRTANLLAERGQPIGVGAGTKLNRNKTLGWDKETLKNKTGSSTILLPLSQSRK